MDTQYKPMNVDQLPDRIEYLKDQISTFNEELRYRKQELADLLSPYKPGNIVAVTARRWHGNVKENFIQHWHVERVLPPSWRDEEFRLYGRIVKKDKTLGLREREITGSATIVAESLEDYVR